MRQSSTPNITRSGRLGVRMLAQFLLILTVLLSSFTAAMAEEPTSAGDAPDPAVLEAVETPTPEPTPTEMPTPEPTPEPTATVEPTPTEMELPAAEPTATVVPTVEPTEVVEPTPTATPMPSPTKQPMDPAPLAVLAGTGACRLVSDDVVGHKGELVEYRCDNLGNPGDFSVSVTAPSRGWAYGIGPIDGKDTRRTGPTEPIRLDLAPASKEFPVYFARLDTAVTGCGRITVTLTSLTTGATKSTTLRARPHGTGWGECTYDDPAPPVQPITASLVGGELRPVAFSFGERRVENAMHIRVENPSNVAGWALDVSATELVYTGTVAGQGNWPASSLLVRVGGSTVSLSEASQRIVEIGGDKASYEYPMTLVIPGGSAVGTYTGTVTLTTTAAPGS